MFVHSCLHAYNKNNNNQNHNYKKEYKTINNTQQFITNEERRYCVYDDLNTERVRESPCV